MITKILTHLSSPVKIGLFTVIFVLFIENTVFTFNNLQNKRAIIGLKVNAKDVSAFDRATLVSLLKKEIAAAKPLQLTYKGKIFEIKPLELGANIDTDTVANQLIEEGRKGTLIEKFTEQQKALFGLKNLKLWSVSQTLLTLKLLELQDGINVDAKPIMPDFKGNLENTLPSRDGVRINTSKLTILIMDNIFNPPATPILIPTIKTFATNHNESELKPLRIQAREVSRSPISISSAGLVFTLTPSDIRSLLTLVERPSSKDPSKIVLQLRLDEKELNRKLGTFAERVQKFTNAEFDEHDARVAIYAQFYAKNRRVVAIPTGKNLEKRNVLGATTNGSKIAYLTFDDGPNSIYHPLILDILKQYNVKATFFLIGQNTQRDTDVARRTVAEGHNIGNHSLTHAFLPNLSTAGIFNELNSTDNILNPIYRQNISIFRPPYGGVNVAVKQNSDKLGLKLYLWDVDPRDWTEPGVDELVRRVVGSTNNGSDILMHSNHLATVRALPKIIESLRSLGYSFEVLK